MGRTPGRAPQPSPPAERPRSTLSPGAWLAWSSVAVAVGVAHAVRYAWVTDDAYISFRYARNLVRGAGLVFNAGERVEGYTNFLWTLWCALGLRLGFSPEAWSVAWGVILFAAWLALLCAFTESRRRRGAAFALPVAALLAALHRDAAIFATSGLETSLFCLLALGGFLLLAGNAPGPRRLAAAGLLLGLAALTRPDGVLFAAVGAVFVAWTARPRARRLLAYAAPLLALGLPYLAWKLHYYGDVFPNTYYAKSAGLAWYDQGLAYAGLYFRRYWVLLAGLPLVGWWMLAARRPPPGGRDSPPAERAWRRSAILAASFALVYTAYVIRVGGDFMFARLLIPATPFYLILLELGIEGLAARPALLRPAAATAAAIAVTLGPSPLSGQTEIRGIVDEHEYYRALDRSRSREIGEGLQRCFDGLPVRVAFIGTQAILAYYSDAPVAIEATAGLTDSLVAHQPLERRGRIGHEKPAPFSYLISTRRANMILTQGPRLADSLVAYIPVVLVGFGGLTATLLHWDPDILPKLAACGARVEDFPARMDRYIAHLPELPDETVRADYQALRRFYFDFVDDPARERPFIERLAARTQRADASPAEHRRE